MVLPHGKGDLYHKYRPRRFKEVAGHKAVISSIKRAVLSKEPSQAYLLIGDSGTGKTTTARIMALALNCESLQDGEPCLKCRPCQMIQGGNCPDLVEVNAADTRGIGDVRALCKTMLTMPMMLSRKVYILDEAHQLTNEAQHSILKELEEAPKHVFIILCSTHPKKILPTVKNRCQKFSFGSLTRKDLRNLLEEVVTLEGRELSDILYNNVIDSSAGSPRQALVFLQQLLQVDEKDLVDASRQLLLGEGNADPNVIKICFALDGGRSSWSKVVASYNDVKHMGAPAIGMIVGGYFRNKLLKTGSIKYYKVLEHFKHPFDDGKLGESQIVWALYSANQILVGYGK